MCLHKASWENESNFNNLLLTVYKANGYFRHFFPQLSAKIWHYDREVVIQDRKAQQMTVGYVIWNTYLNLSSKQTILYADEIPLNFQPYPPHI